MNDINREDRANRILAAYDLLPDTDDKPDIQEILYDVMDGQGQYDDASSIHRLVRDSFQSDDDFDDLEHEIEHAMQECTDDNPDCPWGF